jgi:hypothetical protein
LLAHYRNESRGQSLCMQELIFQFLNEPTRAPDASCIARMNKVSFQTRWQ